MYIDCHVHTRDFKETHKETIQHSLEVARDSGLDAIYAIGNTKPTTDNEEMILDTKQRVKEANVPEVRYGVYLLVDGTAEQMKRVTGLYRRHWPFVVGLKMFAGDSTNHNGVTLEGQYTVFEIAAKEGFDGVLGVHCERSDMMKSGLWIPSNPITHCFARPAEAEIASVADEIYFATTTKFPGKLHILHVSAPESIEKIVNAKDQGLDISCGVCPHHFFYDWSQMYNEQGILWKMNPPLREPGSQQKMLAHLKVGNIDWIETDHAPHTLNEKTKHDGKQGYLSGIPGLPWWPYFEEFLWKQGFTEKRIQEVTFSNVRDRFGIDIPETKREIKDRRTDYPFNPYWALERQLGYH
ncbi:hypothetical protein KW805_01045 [Candidatus Pacearchaeota archaeon]|nr:hypothetical protein [Candidatus Pacearchaeota archaeon]